MVQLIQNYSSLSSTPAIYNSRVTRSVTRVLAPEFTVNKHGELKKKCTNIRVKHVSFNDSTSLSDQGVEMTLLKVDQSFSNDCDEDIVKKRAVSRRRKRGTGSRFKNLSISSGSSCGNDSLHSPTLPPSDCIESIPAHILRPHHYLRSSWTFWLYSSNPAKSWEQNQAKLATVGTVEDFWLVFNRIWPASELPPGYDFSVFRAGVFPDWEDFQNMAGGRWVFHGSSKDKSGLDTAWLEILMFLIGEHAGEEASLLNGGVVNMRRKEHRISLWLKEARSMEKVVSIGRMMKAKLGGVENASLQFCLHQEDRQLATSDRKGRDRLNLHL